MQLRRIRRCIFAALVATAATGVVVPRAPVLADQPAPAPLASAGALSSESPTPGPVFSATRPDAEAIFLRCVDAVNDVPVPAYIAFTLVDDSVHDGVPALESVRFVVRTADGHAYSRQVRDFAGNNERGVTEILTGPWSTLTAVYRPGDFPLADFGMRRNTSRPGIFEALDGGASASAPTPTPVPTAPDAYPLLASVKSSAHRYVASERRDTVIDKHEVYHIVLRPPADPSHNVLRELWVDKTTFLPVRILAERYVGSTYLDARFSYVVSIDTAMLQGHLVNDDLKGEINIFRSLINQTKGNVHLHFADVSFPESEPDWPFDPSEYDAHRQDRVPGF